MLSIFSGWGLGWLVKRRKRSGGSIGCPLKTKKREERPENGEGGRECRCPYWPKLSEDLSIGMFHFP